MVGVDRPMMAPSLHIQRKALLGNNSLSICQKKQLYEPNSIMYMFNVSTLYKQSIKLFHRKLL